MPIVLVIIVFLCGVVATIVAYNSGVAQRVPVWFGYDVVEGPVVVTPPAVVTTGPGDATLVTTPPAIVTTGGPPVVDSEPTVAPDNDDYPTNGYPTNGYPQTGYPAISEPTVVTKSDEVLATGSPLRVNIFRSETGFEAQCTAYKIVNRSQRVLMLSFHPRHGRSEGFEYKKEGTLLKPGETLDEDSFPVECVEFRSLFNEGRVEGPRYGPPGEDRHGRGFGGPIVKIEIEDCPHDNCAVAQF